MNSRIKYISVFLFLLAAGYSQAYAQLYPERKHVRKGNKDYEALEYGASEGDYRTAAMKNPGSFEAMFNLGDALCKQERFEEAENTFNGILENGQAYGLDEAKAAQVFHNLGNAQFGQRKLKEAAESYANSLVHNPSDMETKYNLAYVQKLLENQQGGGGGGNDDQNQDNDRNQDQNQDQNQGGDNKQDKNDGQGDQDQDKGDENQDKGDDKQDGQDKQDQNQNQPDKPDATPPQREGAMSVADAEKMLEAMQQEEDKTRDKVNEKQAVTTTKSGKNW